MSSCRWLRKGLLREKTRLTDVVARLGGDEFAVLIGDVPCRAKLDEIVTRLHEFLVQPYIIDGKTCPATASTGMAIFPENGETYQELMRHADLALYSAKNLKGSLQIYGSKLSEEQKRRQEVEVAIRDALSDDLFSLVFQPQVTATTHKLVGAEALLRLHHPDFGWISPVDIVGSAEENGLIRDIGRWVVRNAARQTMTWRCEWI